jgi:hypothetical protein
MNVTIQKLNGLWHLIVGSCQIRTPFLETQNRALVVAYARRVYPGARIFERDWRLRKEWGSTHAGQVYFACSGSRFALDGLEE